jgi:ATP-dependent DNA ligase
MSNPARRKSKKPKRPGSMEESWPTPEVERLEVAKRSQAESGANVHQSGHRWRTETSGPWRRRCRDPEEAGQVAGCKRPSEEE